MIRAIRCGVAGWSCRAGSRALDMRLHREATGSFKGRRASSGLGTISPPWAQRCPRTPPSAMARIFGDVFMPSFAAGRGLGQPAGSSSVVRSARVNFHSTAGRGPRSRTGLGDGVRPRASRPSGRRRRDPVQVRAGPSDAVSTDDIERRAAGPTAAWPLRAPPGRSCRNDARPAQNAVTISGRSCSMFRRHAMPNCSSSHCL